MACLIICPALTFKLEFSICLPKTSFTVMVTFESTTLEFTSPVDSKVTITVNDVLGRQIENSNLNVSAGQMIKHAINPNSSLNAGIYFVTLNLGNQKVTKKLIIE